MMHYSIQPRDPIFVKGYGFLSFTKNMGKNISKNLSGKYSKKLLDHAKQSATDALETTAKRAIQKTAEETGYFIGNKIADKSQKLPKRIIQKQLKMSKIKKYLKKDVSLQKKGRKSLMI